MIFKIMEIDKNVDRGKRGAHERAQRNLDIQKMMEKGVSGK